MKVNITESEKKSILKMYGLLNEQTNNNIDCTDSSCKGTYTGPEFNQQGDIAHQFSNAMSSAVGNKLKELYNKKMYSMVDFSSIKMTTPGMGTGNVVYTLEIPFKQVSEPCQAYTSFDHSGGWGHDPQLGERESELKSALLPGDNLNISPLKRTKEGLQEYWIQWRNKGLQSNCNSANQGQNSANQGQIVITGKTLDEFRTNIKTQTKGISIDWSSIKLDLSTYTLTMNPGKSKLVNMSLIQDNVSEQNLLRRYNGGDGEDWEGKKEGDMTIVDRNTGYTVYIAKGPINTQGFWFLLIAFT